MKQSNESKREGIIFAFIMLTLSGIFIWRCQYGVNLNDELSYLSSLKRVLQGDRFFIDDWSPTTLLSTWIEFQLVRWLPIEFGEGCVLHARYLYIFLQAFITIILFSWLKGHKGRILMPCLYFISTPYNIPALSYNTMAIGFMLLGCVFVVTREKWRKIDFIFVGVLYSLTVLSNPYVAILYFCFLLFEITVYISAGIRKKDIPEVLRFTSFSYITLGISICAGVFLLSIIMQGDWQQSIYSLSYVLGDSEHSDTGLFAKTIEAVWLIIRVWWRCTLPIGIIGIYTILSRKKENRKRDCVLLGITVFITLYATFRFAYIYGSISINLMIVPMAIMGAECFFLYKGNKKYMYGCWLFAGYLFAICNYVSSNTGVLSMSAMFIVPAIASVGLLTLVMDQLWQTKERRSTLFLCISVIPLICILFMIHQRIICTWYDMDYALLTERIERGPCKGMFTSEERKAEYDSILQIVDELDIKQEEKVLFLPVKPLYYLYSEGRVGAPYTIRIQWESGELIPYYEENTQHLPELVVADMTNQNDAGNEENMQYMVSYFIEAGYIRQQSTENVVVLQKYMQDNKK